MWNLVKMCQNVKGQWQNLLVIILHKLAPGVWSVGFWEQVMMLRCRNGCEAGRHRSMCIVLWVTGRGYVSYILWRPPKINLSPVNLYHRIKNPRTFCSLTRTLLCSKFSSTLWHIALFIALFWLNAELYFHFCFKKLWMFVGKGTNVHILDFVQGVFTGRDSLPRMTSARIWKLM